MMIEKKDWETILKNNEKQKSDLIHNHEMALPQVEALITLAQYKMLEFPEDPPPAEVKEVVKDLVK